MKKILLLLAVSLCLASVPVMADVIVGLPPDPGTGNCFPFGCSYANEYQQVYTASAFSGPITITNLEFYNTQFNSGSTSLPSGTFTISLSTTSADWNTLNPTMSANIGANNTVVFSGSIEQPWAFGDTLHIVLTTPFTYDPSMGNLLMDVMTNSTVTSSNTYFDVNSTGSQMGRVYCPSGIDCGGVGVVNSNYGLVTGFSTGTSVPEPSSMLLLGSGIVGLAGMLRRKINL